MSLFSPCCLSHDAGSLMRGKMIQLSSYGLFLETFSKKIPTCLLDCIEICLAMDGGLKSLTVSGVSF